MGDYKMECPGCGSWTNSVGLALRDDEPCPYCDLPAEATRLVLAARNRSTDEALIARVLAAEKALVVAEIREAAAASLVHQLRGALDAYDRAIAGATEGKPE